MQFEAFLILTLIAEILSCKKLHHRTLPHNHHKHHRIYNGKETKLSEVGSHLVQIIKFDSLVCTGSLLTPRHVLTAAHCFNGAISSSYHVIAGQAEYYRYSQSEEKNYLDNVIIHPQYRRGNIVGDIAIFSVSKPIRGPHVSYIPLCSKDLETGDRVQISGWGSSEFFLRQNNLRTIEAPIVSLKECSQKFNWRMPLNVICASGYNGKTPCFGDSGGSMVHNGEICGVTSATESCGNNNFPDIYMNVYYYRYFIREAIEKLHT